MNENSSSPKALIFGVLFVFLIAFSAGLVIKTARHSIADLEVYGRTPQFTLEDMNGDMFSSDEMRGKIWIVDFIFTNCPNACPIMSEQMSQLYKLYSHSDRVHFLSLSVDPTRDTKSALQRYAKDQGVNDTRWSFVRGELDKIIDISENGFSLAAENLPMGHSTKFILIDEKMQIRGYYDGLVPADIERLKLHVRELARHMK